jgi:TRAP-type C4-dicarboxylate transport system permease small subunit
VVVLIRVVDRLAVLLAGVAAGLLTISILVVCWMVGVRLAGHSTYWELEMSIYLAVAATFLASPYTLKTGGHVAVDLLGTVLSGPAHRTTQRGLGVVGLAVCLFLGWLGGEMAWHAFVSDERSTSLWKPPLWPLYATLPVGMLLTALQYVVEIVAPDRAKGEAAKL